MSTLLPNSLVGVDLVNDNAIYLQDSDTDYVLSQIDDAIDLAATGTQLVIRGTVGSDLDDGIEIHADAANNSIIIADTGIVSGDREGIEINGNLNTISNNGKIIGQDDGIVISGGSNVVNNFGEIEGIDSGIYSSGISTQIYNHGQITGGQFGSLATIFLSGVGNHLVVNTGTIVALGEKAGVQFGPESGGNTLFNSGIISGQNNHASAVFGSDGSDTVINTGTINGSVTLGSGNDLFNGTGGEVFGSVVGGAGKDHYIVDDPTLTLIEALNEGIDTVEADTNWTLGTHFENLILLGDGDHSGVGNNSGNVIKGNIGDNAIRGGGGDDRLSGGAGEDAITGGAGRDFLFGGADADRFVYNSIVETPVGGGRDRIKQFSSAEGDLIDLAGMDADIDSAGDDSFIFIGTSGFSGSAGELRYIVNNAGHAIVSGDITGDGTADFEIAVLHTAVLTAGDFLL